MSPSQADSLLGIKLPLHETETEKNQLVLFPQSSFRMEYETVNFLAMEQSPPHTG